MIKYHCMFATGFMLVLILLTSCNKKPVPQGINTITELKSLFAGPPSEYRSIPL